jgi:hypothetical protein
MAGVAVDVVGAVEDACLAGAEAALWVGGFVPPPQIHMLIDDWDRPYVGYVGTRSYHQGTDAVDAITRLGDAPAAIAATRVLLVWEAADLQISLNGPGEFPNGLVVVVASLVGGHMVRWHPFALHVAGLDASGRLIVEPQWGRSSALPDAVLPPVMTAVLGRWRSLDGDSDTVFAELLADGFDVRLASAETRHVHSRRH